MRTLDTDKPPSSTYYFLIMATERTQRRIDSLLDEAEEAIAQLDWQVVHTRSQAALALDPNNPDAINYLAAAERGLGVTPDLVSPTPQAETTLTEPASTATNKPEAERRQLTVMFCDLQGSTALSQQFDPEELREVIRSYQEVCAGAVSRFEGHIAKYLGDGLLIYFGYPQAHEDDPQRAVRAGLAILEDMGQLNIKLKADNELELGVRVGIHTGLVVAGEMGGGDTVEELAIVGETPNVAARLQEAAEPKSVVISDVTANLVQGFFLCEALGFHDLKGISQPMELFAVLSESGAQTRFDVAAGHLTPLVGREQEVGLLLDRWEQATEGMGQVVLLSGEAGIGKSRLIEEVTERLADETHAHRRLRCSAYHQYSALHPVLEYLKSWLGFGREDSDEERLGKLENSLAKVDFPLAEAVPLLSGLLSLPLAEQFPALAMSPEVQRDRTRELLVTLLLDTPEDQPVFIVFEDLQWADPSTLAMLDFLLDQILTAKVIALLSFRPEFTPPWSSRSYVTPIMLSRLTRRLAGEMVGRLTGGKTLPKEVLNQVAVKSDGVPIFVEELTRMLLESDLLKEVGDHYELTGPLAPLAIPSTLQASLTARLDRLSSAREIAQIGAVLGREFTYELIKAVSPLDDELLGSHLQRLVNAEFLYQRGLPPDANYIFKHTLIQDAAYESLLRSDRQQYHRTVAGALEEGFYYTVETQPELLAHHFMEAGLVDRAVPYLQKAGDKALANYANQEALTYFQQVLAVKESEGMSPEVATALFGLGRSQLGIFQRGLLPEAFANLARAFDYFVELGDTTKAVWVADCIVDIRPQLFAGRQSGLDQLITRALTLITPDSPQAGHLLSSYGQIVGQEKGDYTAAKGAFTRALSVARSHADPDLEIRTLLGLAQVELFQEHNPE